MKCDVVVIGGDREINIIRTFAGLRPYTPNGLPILAKVKNMALW